MNERLKTYAGMIGVAGALAFAGRELSVLEYSNITTYPDVQESVLVAMPVFEKPLTMKELLKESSGFDDASTADMNGDGIADVVFRNYSNTQSSEIMQTKIHYGTGAGYFRCEPSLSRVDIAAKSSGKMIASSFMELSNTGFYSGSKIGVKF